MPRSRHEQIEPPFVTPSEATSGDSSNTLASGDFLKSSGDPSASKSLGEIEARLGRPKKAIVQPSSRFLSYSGTDVSGSYYIRNVGLDASGRVNKVVAGFHQD